MARILLVEDYYETREIYAELLQKKGHEVVKAADGEEGLRKILEGGFNLILLDLLLPRKNGLDVLRALKQQKPLSPNGKIVAMYVEGQDELAKEAAALGAAGSILKSRLSESEVLDSILKFLQ